MSGRTTVVLDVDGTLVDSNYQHAIAWHRAFKAHGYRAAIWELHRHVGMGGDQSSRRCSGPTPRRPTAKRSATPTPRSTRS